MDIRVNSKKGFSLIELIVAVVVLGFAVISLSKAFMDVSKVTFEAEYRDQQVLLAQEMLEEIRSRRFDEKTTKSGEIEIWTPVGNLGPDGGESLRSQYDDIDDYHGFSENLTGSLAGYSRSVTVGYVDAEGELDEIVSDPSQDLKLVRVKISKSPLEDYEVETLIGNQQSKAFYYG